MATTCRHFVAVRESRSDGRCRGHRGTHDQCSERLKEERSKKWRRRRQLCSVTNRNGSLMFLSHQFFCRPFVCAHHIVPSILSLSCSSVEARSHRMRGQKDWCDRMILKKTLCPIDLGTTQATRSILSFQSQRDDRKVLLYTTGGETEYD